MARMSRHWIGITFTFLTRLFIIAYPAVHSLLDNDFFTIRYVLQYLLYLPVLSSSTPSTHPLLNGIFTIQFTFRLDVQSRPRCAALSRIFRS